MANLHFLYGPMSASKSTKLITDRFNFIKKKTNVSVLRPVNDRTNEPVVRSRLGIECPAIILDKITVDKLAETNALKSDVIMVDEIQFFTPADIDELVKVADKYNKLVFCYGLLVDVNENMFPASRRLIEVGAKLHEMSASCENEGCMNLANHHLRYKANGELIKDGKSVVIDNNNKIVYKSVCRLCYNKAMGR